MFFRSGYFSSQNFYPCRAAGCEQRQIALLDLFHQLGGFFNDRQVSSEVGIVNLIEPHVLRRPPASRAFFAFRRAELIAYGDPLQQVRSVLRPLCSCLPGFPYRMDILIYRDSACRAYHTALTAAHAGGLRKRTAEGCADAHLASSVDKVYYAQGPVFPRMSIRSLRRGYIY